MSRQNGAGGLVTRRQLAEAFDKKIATIARWAGDGMPCAVPATRKGQTALYKLSACIAWRIERELLAHGVGVDTTTLSPHLERAALDRKRGEEIELRMRIRRGELIERDEATRALADCSRVTCQRVRQVPSTCIVRVAQAVRSQGEGPAATVMRHALDDALRELAALGDPPMEGEKQAS